MITQEEYRKITKRASGINYRRTHKAEIAAYKREYYLKRKQGINTSRIPKPVSQEQLAKRMSTLQIVKNEIATR